MPKKKGKISVKADKVKKVVRARYSEIAKQNSSCCSTISSCCDRTALVKEISKKIGYTEKELGTVPKESNLGLGCGNPIALASLKKGETVLDLGSGAGFDCFLAANKVGKTGKVIGVDMTPEMIEKARANARKNNYGNVEFRLGEIENIPVADNSVDVVISNCVINLSPEKERVFKEAFRALKPGGRLMVSDIVLLNKLPDFITKSVEAYVGCVAGATMKDKYVQMIKTAGFQSVKILDEKSFPVDFIADSSEVKSIINKLKISKTKIKNAMNSVASIKVLGIKLNKRTAR
jgi:ubiquinone/menaquinone biosynthesis C-methylase UbiE